jgi:DNA-binding NarL/FixJ family response regulator
MRILIVEDNQWFAQALEAAVALLDGFSVIGRATCASDALDLARKHCDTIDIVALDLRLPHVSGHELMPQLKQLLPNARIIVVSQSDKEHDVVQALTRGADGYLLKDASVTSIVESLQSVAEGCSPIDPHVAGHLLGRVRERRINRDYQPLTERELDVLKLLAEGQTKKEIANRLYVSYGTVDTHVKSIYSKLNTKNVAEAITIGYKTGLIQLD